MVHLVLITVELLIAECHSLKQKRSVIKAIKDRVNSKFNASIAEVAEQNKWQRSVLAITIVSSDQKFLDRTSLSVIEFIEGNHKVRIIDQHREFL